MKALMMCLTVMFLLSACGKDGGGGEGSSSHQAPLEVFELNAEEKELIQKLIEKRQIEHRELLKSLLGLKILNDDVLKRLDNYINVECFTNVCHILEKEIR